ncbi:zinc-binding alcohol dehydrogenase family protein [Paraburkholderia xenovorans]|uniref:zinc-binding alcohol dehydrogenase family protein n=1 Tax=Paraburkholderia xenovorans TaxID=36873 RepID=UPI0038BBA0B5
MKAIGLYKALPADHPESLVDLDIPYPRPGVGDLLVRVEAISVNPADCRARRRKVDDGQHAILGWDVAGTVVEIGPGVAGNFSVGDAVYYAGDLNRAGGNCQFHAVDARLVGRRPQTLPVEDAAAIPLVALTAWEALFERMGFKRSGKNRLHSLLIVGAAGGVGSMAIQLAKLVPDLVVIATASRAESRAWCLKLGADAVIDHATDLQHGLADIGSPKVDAVLLLGEPDVHFPNLAQLIEPHGHLCSVVPFERPIDLNLLMRKSVTFTWEFMFTRSMFNTDDVSVQADILNEMSMLIDKGLIAPIATQTLAPINAPNLRLSHQLLDTRRTIGKITLKDF